MELKRVVVTGLGALTPIGNNIEEYWDGLVNGKSGSAPITYFDTEKFKTKFACEIKNFNFNDYFDRKEIDDQNEGLEHSEFQLSPTHQHLYAMGNTLSRRTLSKITINRAATAELIAKNRAAFSCCF